MADSEREFLTFNGEPTQEETENCFAKQNKNLKTGMTYYYIKIENGRMIQPLDRDQRRRFKEQAKWRKVNRDIYLLYKKFLETNRLMYLTQAERKCHG